jgi:hypothetical protein
VGGIGRGNFSGAPPTSGYMSRLGPIETTEELRQLLFEVPGDTAVEIEADIAHRDNRPGALPLALAGPRRPCHLPGL